MKNTIFSGCLLIAFATMFSSCSDFLTENPKGRLTPSKFYTNQNEIELALNALYAKVQAYQCNSNPMIMYCQGDDVTSTTGSNKSAYLSADAYERPTDTKGLEDGWRRMYHIILVSNDIINRAPKAKITKENLDIALGQAYYWRAYSYFVLVRLFGALPMNLTNLPDNNATPLTSVEGVYERIISDLESAEKCNLPAQYTQEPMAINGQNLYVSQQAVKATMAAVYMSMAGYPLNKTEYYAMAAAKAKEVIDGVNSGKYNHGLLTNWQDVYSYGKNHHFETILGIDYNTKTGGWSEGDSQLSSCHQFGSLNGWGDFLPERKFWLTFPDGPRKDAVFAKQIRTSSKKGILVDWWATVDGEPYNGSNAVVGEYRPMFVAFTVNDGPEVAPYDYKKPFWGGMCIGKRHQLIRYSEVLLWYAESAARANKDLSEAKNALKAVRQRAYANVAKVTEVDAMNAEQLAEAAYQEHGYEVGGYVLAMVTRRSDEFRMNRLKENYDYRSGDQKMVLVPKGTLTSSMNSKGEAFTYTLKEDLVLKENMSVTAAWSNENSIYHNYPPKEAEKNPNLKR